MTNTNEWYEKDTSKQIRAVIRSKGNAGRSTTNTPPYGFVFDGNDVDKWLINDSAAIIVRRIFSEFALGRTATDIARRLNADKVLSPLDHKRLHTFKNKQKIIPNGKAYKWTASTIYWLLDNPIYVGTLVIFKSFSPSYKNKKRFPTPESEQKAILNHHEPIIDQSTWEAVRNLRKFKRKYTKQNEAPLFSGYVFCADCGAKMTFLSRKRVNNNGTSNNGYICSAYRRDSKTCSTHYIKAEVLKELILERIRFVTDFAKSSEKEFSNIAYKASVSVSEREKKWRIKGIAKAQKRENELYEDKVAGNITVEVFNRLSEKYLTEQHQLEEKIQDLTEQTEKLKNRRRMPTAF